MNTDELHKVRPRLAVAGRWPRWGVGLVLLCALAQACGQGSVTVRFEVPQLEYVEYHESGVKLLSLGASQNYGGFLIVGPTMPSLNPSNGTSYLWYSGANTLQISLDTGSSFGLLSLDLAKYASFWTGPVTAHFIGYRQDGSTVATDLTTDTTLFQTFSFGPEFSDLSRAEITTFRWSMDNLVIAIPEPGPAALLALGGVSLGFLRLRHRRRPNGISTGT